MKKPTQKQRDIIRRLNVKHRKNSTGKIQSKKKIKNHRIHVRFARKLSLFIPAERAKIDRFLKSIPQNTHDKLYLDFYDVKIIEPLTALHIVHILDKYRNTNTRFKSRNCKELIPRSVFKFLGINKVLGLPDINKTNYNAMVDDWSMFSGESCDLPEDMIQKIRLIKDKFKDKNIFFKLSTAINEAINNVIQHAYTSIDYKKWFVLIHLSDKSITVVVSDLGVSIPATAPVSIVNNLSNIYDNTKGLISGNTNIDELREFKDSKLIKLATVLHSTRTNEKGRGKGFDDILDIVRRKDEFPEISKVNTSVLSRQGSYLLESRSDGSIKENSLNKSFEDFDTKINGTVISWVIQLA